MPWPTGEISAGNYTKLRGTGAQVSYYADTRVYVWPINTIFAARVNGAVSTSAFGFVNWDGATTGAYTDIEVGMTIYISATNDITKAYWFGRIRKAAAATTLYVNEISQPIADNDYIFVVEDFRIWPKLAFENFGVQSKDFDISFRQIPPYFTLLKSAYATEVSSGVGTFSFDATAQAATSGASISTYLWDVEDGTITVGSTSTAAITATFPQGKRYISCTVTDSGSRTTTIQIPVVVNGPDHESTLAVRNIRIQRQGGGMSATLTADSGVTLSSVLDGALVIIYDAVENYNGTNGSLYDNILFVGRLRNESTPTQGDEQYSVVSETQFTVDGPDAQLASIHGASIAMRNTASPTVWDEINDYTYQRGIVHFLREHTTFLELHSLQFDETFDSTCETIGDTTKTDTGALDCVRWLAEQRQKGRIEFAPSGEARISRRATLMTTAQRSALTTAAQFTDGSSSTNSDLLGYNAIVEHVKPAGQSSVDCGTFNTTTSQVQSKIGIGPGTAQDTGIGKAILRSQAIAANQTLAQLETEAKRLVGDALADANMLTRLPVQFPDGYHFLIPSQSYWHTYVIASTDNTRGRAFTSSQRWLLESLTIDIDTEAGTRAVAGDVLLETQGYSGIIFDPPAPSEIPLDIPNIPIEDAYPIALPEIPPVLDIPLVDALPIVNADESVAPRNGNTVMFGNATSVYRTTEMLRSNIPICEDITPSGITAIQMAIFDRNASSKAAYALDTDSTDSSVFEIDNALTAPDNWADGATLNGVYTLLRWCGGIGALMVYSTGYTGGGTWTEPRDFAASAGDFVDYVDGDLTSGDHAVYTAGVGWTHGDAVRAGTTYYRNVRSQLSFSASTITGISFNYDLTKGTFAEAGNLALVIGYNASNTLKSTQHGDASNGTNATYAWTGSQAGVTSIFLFCISSTTSDGSYSGSATIRSVIITGTGTNPFAATAGDAIARHSASGGESWSVEISIGATPGSVGGFDVIGGGVSFGGADAQAKRATSFGGSYSNAGSALTAGDPILLIVPWNRRNSSTSNFGQGSSTECIIGASALNGSNEALWWLIAAGTMTNITPHDGSHYGIPVGPNCLIVHRGTHLAGIFLFNATRKFCTSTDGGGTWTVRESVDSSTDSIMQPRSQKTAQLLYYNYEGSGTGITVSNDWGVTRVRKQLPITPTYLDILS